MDLGFENAGFEIVYANDNWKGCWENYEKNHNLKMDRRSIEDVEGEDIPDVLGFIGGPPCQSWSLAGSMKGINDSRGQLLYDYVRLIESKKPKFFLAENVPGMVCKTHLDEFEKFKDALKSIGYNISFKILNANDYDVPQDRKRVLLVGLDESLNMEFEFPKPYKTKPTLRDAIYDLPEPLPACGKNKANPINELDVANHEYMTGDFSSMYMSRNRVRKWDEASFTIQAGGRHAPCHPQANTMIKVDKDKRIFDP